jgi:transketolase
MDAFTWTDLDRRAVDTVRVLAADAVQKVGNGHPGTAMSLAPAAYVIFQRFLRHDPADPLWLGRDRFVLSCGHSSLTLYLQLFMSGYDLSLDDLKSFRTWGSRTPGHPEFGHTDGVETTTGPLGQGLATAVGMAMAARYTRGLLDPAAAEGESPFDHTVWVLASDGDLQEGVTSEASSIAGHQGLGSLVVVWDDNRISIEGNTAVAWSEDVVARYDSYGWHTQSVEVTANGDVDVQALAEALESARAERSRPSLIRLRTIIGWPAPTLQNTGKAHGAALGADEVAATKSVLGFDPDEDFHVDDDVLSHARSVAQRGAEAHRTWDQTYTSWRERLPDQAAVLDRLLSGAVPEDLGEHAPTFDVGTSMATRAASGHTLNALSRVMPELWGGSADLGESNNTTIEGGKSFLPMGSSVPEASPYGRIVHFGIREHAMGAILNGIALHGLTRAFGGTFLVFSDYMRGAVRLAALMQVPSTFVWTHDSIGLGEDGPTHQPVEHLWALRAMPGLHIVRPADANETAAAWIAVLGRRQPVGMVLSRQAVPVLEPVSPADVDRGGYVKREASAEPKVLLLATGTEVSIALKAQETLEAEGIPTRVVSLPCLSWFDAQDDQYRQSVLPKSTRARVAVEAGSTLGWWKYVGDSGHVVGIDHFGASADASTLYREFGVTAEAVVAAAKLSLSSL